MLNVTAEATYKSQGALALEEQRLLDLKFPHDGHTGIGHSDAVKRAEAAIQPLRDDVAAMQAVIGGKVFLLPEQNLPLLSDKLAKLNARATKLGVAPVEHTVTLEQVERKTGENAYGEATYTVFTYVAVRGNSPKLDGWQFAATLEHDENGVIVRRLPGLDDSIDLSAYREADPGNCDQCGYFRRRNDTYLVRHESGEIKQVGSTCLADFLGGQSPERIAQWLSYVADLLDDLGNEGSEFYGGTAPLRTNTLWFLTHVACMIREHGWTSRGSAYNYGGVATADSAASNMDNLARKRTDRQGAPLWTDVTAEDGELAAAAIDHVRSLDEAELENDYLYNLFTSLKGESIPSRQYGIAASAITFYQKAVQRQIEAEQKAVSDFVGTVGVKLSVQVTITRVIEITDRYSYNGGTKPLYIMLDAFGNQIKWFASRYIDGMDQGVTGTLSGTVKSHEDDPKFGKSTMVTRCKFAA